MDELFHADVLGNNFHFGWNYDDPTEVAPITRTSTFVLYVEIPEDWIPNGDVEVGGARPATGFGHMLSERSRRERQQQSCDDLPLQLPHGTKNYKNSIDQAAAKEIVERTREREELLRRYQEMNGGGDSLRRGTATNIKVRVMNLTSRTNSLVVVLTCLQSLGVKTTTVRTEFSAGELSAVIEIENEIEAAEVGKQLFNVD